MLPNFKSFKKVTSRRIVIFARFFSFFHMYVCLIHDVHFGYVCVYALVKVLAVVEPNLQSGKHSDAIAG